MFLKKSLKQIPTIGKLFSSIRQNVVIVGAKRTPIGSFLGSISDVPATQLGAIATKAAINQAKLKPQDITECIMGTCLPAGTGQVPARQVALHSGLPESTICTTINKACASGMKSVIFGAQSIMLGHHDTVLAGGFENMSLAPHAVYMRKGTVYQNATLIDTLQHDGLKDAFNGMMMGNCTEKTANQFGITREMQDEFAIESYKRARSAQERGDFQFETTPVTIKGRKGDKIFDKDEECQKFAPQKFPALKPAFMKNGTITPANASKINDGACSIVLMAEQVAKAKGIKPLAKIKYFADGEIAPIDFSIAPTTSTKKLMEKSGYKLEDMDYIEINEAFSCVTLANMKLMDLDWEKVNVNGGAVALGHPIGASGARIILSLINVLNSRNGKLGLATICNGGGGASSMIIEKM